jgi:hypothetical protein
MEWQIQDNYVLVPNLLDSISIVLIGNSASGTLIVTRTRWFALCERNCAVPSISRETAPFVALCANNASKTHVLEVMHEIAQEKVMLREAASEVEIEIGSVASWGSEWSVPGPDWRRVDRALRAIRRRRAVLDAEEARWLREAEALQIWRPLGMVSALDYMERVLGYAPRTAQDRLRVARALGDLPQLTAALAADELAFSAVRELTRVATPGTEAAWIAQRPARTCGRSRSSSPTIGRATGLKIRRIPRRARTSSGSSCRPRRSRCCARRGGCSMTSTG